MCEKSDSPKQSLVKAFGRDKLIQEDLPSRKAGVTRHAHMQDSLWNPDTGGKEATATAYSLRQTHKTHTPGPSRPKLLDPISLRIPG